MNLGFKHLKIVKAQRFNNTTHNIPLPQSVTDVLHFEQTLNICIFLPLQVLFVMSFYWLTNPIVKKGKNIFWILGLCSVYIAELHNHCITRYMEVVFGKQLNKG